MIDIVNDAVEIRTGLSVAGGGAVDDDRGVSPANISQSHLDLCGKIRSESLDDDIGRWGETQKDLLAFRLFQNQEQMFIIAAQPGKKQVAGGKTPIFDGDTPLRGR